MYCDEGRSNDEQISKEWKMSYKHNIIITCVNELVSSLYSSFGK